MAVSPAFEKYVAQGIEQDRLDLFDFADHFLQLATGREWAGWFVSAPTGYYLSHYLRTVHQLSSETPADQPPLFQIANGDVGHYPFHQEVVRKHVEASGILSKGRNALLVTGVSNKEMQMSYPEQTLGGMDFREIDVAVMGITYTAYRYPNLFRMTNHITPWLGQDDVIASSGQKCEFGVAEPLISSDADLDMREYIKNALSTVANNYVHSRESSSI